MTVSERIPFSGLLLPLQEGYTYSCDRRTTDGMEKQRCRYKRQIQSGGELYLFRYASK